MIETLSQQQTETPMAAVVTERTNEIETNASRQARRGRRTNVPEPVFETCTSTTGHYSATCPQIGDQPIVARNVPMTAKIAGLPCEWCEPGAAFGDDLVAAEFNRFESRRQGSGSGRTTEPEPTDAQEGFIRSLLADLGIDADEKIAAYRKAGTWTKRQASHTIDDLKADLMVARRQADDQRPAPAANVPAGVEIQNRPNRYSGNCVLCGGHVAEQAGRLGKQNGRWIVAHNDGECVEQAAAAPAAAPGHGFRSDVPEGHYAIPSQGDNDLFFVRIDRPTEGQWAGRVFAKMIVGGHPDQKIAYNRIAGILDRIAEAGVEESAR